MFDNKIKKVAFSKIPSRFASVQNKHFIQNIETGQNNGFLLVVTMSSSAIFLLWKIYMRLIIFYYILYSKHGFALKRYEQKRAEDVAIRPKQDDQAASKDYLQLGPVPACGLVHQLPGSGTLADLALCRQVPGPAHHLQHGDAGLWPHLWALHHCLPGGLGRRLTAPAKIRPPGLQVQPHGCRLFGPRPLVVPECNADPRGYLWWYIAAAGRLFVECYNWEWHKLSVAEARGGGLAGSLSAQVEDPLLHTADAADLSGVAGGHLHGAQPLQPLSPPPSHVAGRQREKENGNMPWGIKSCW